MYNQNNILGAISNTIFNELNKFHDLALRESVKLLKLSINNSHI